MKHYEGEHMGKGNPRRHLPLPSVGRTSLPQPQRAALSAMGVRAKPLKITATFICAMLACSVLAIRACGSNYGARRRRSDHDAPKPDK